MSVILRASRAFPDSAPCNHRGRASPARPRAPEARNSRRTRDDMSGSSRIRESQLTAARQRAVSRGVSPKCYHNPATPVVNRITGRRRSARGEREAEASPGPGSFSAAPEAGRTFPEAARPRLASARAPRTRPAQWPPTAPCQSLPGETGGLHPAARLPGARPPESPLTLTVSRWGRHVRPGGLSGNEVISPGLPAGFKGQSVEAVTPYLGQPDAAFGTVVDPPLASDLQKTGNPGLPLLPGLGHRVRAGCGGRSTAPNPILSVSSGSVAQPVNRMR